MREISLQITAAGLWRDQTALSFADMLFVAWIYYNNLARTGDPRRASKNSQTENNNTL